MHPVASTLLAVGFFAFAAAPAAADLLQCRGPDGRVIFTDKPERCPGAEPYEPSAEIQTATPPPPTAPVPSRDRQRDLAADAERAMAASWARKKREAEGELEQIAEERERLQPFVTHCNRGGLVITRDSSGIKHTVDCDRLRGDLAALDGREERVRDYLEHGLADECRRAGCLPGWIR